MITKRSVIDQIEIRPQEGVVNLRIAKQVVDGDTVIAEQWHRTSFVAATDVNLQMAAVNDHLAAMGCAPVAEWKQLNDQVALARTFPTTVKPAPAPADTATAVTGIVTP